MQEYLPHDYICYTLADPAGIFLLAKVMGEDNLLRAPAQWLRWERERATDGRRTGGGFYVPSIIA